MCLFLLKNFLKNSQRILAWKLKTAFYMYLYVHCSVHLYLIINNVFVLFMHSTYVVGMCINIVR